MSTRESSPLLIIRQKEIELAQTLATAQQSAERAILDAQQWSAEVRAQAEREGHESAAAAYRAELAAVSAEAQCIAAEGEHAAAEMRRRSMHRMNAAAERILQIVLAR